MGIKKKQDENKLYLVSYKELVELSNAYVAYAQFRNLNDLKKAAKRLDKAWKMCMTRSFTNQKELGL